MKTPALEPGLFKIKHFVDRNATETCSAWAGSDEGEEQNLPGSWRRSFPKRNAPALQFWRLTTESLEDFWGRCRVYPALRNYLSPCTVVGGLHPLDISLPEGKTHL